MGWCAVRGNITAGGRWTAREQKGHINVLELQAAFFALKSLASLETELHIQVQLDNSTTVAYINNMWGGGGGGGLLNPNNLMTLH